MRVIENLKSAAIYYSTTAGQGGFEPDDVDRLAYQAGSTMAFILDHQLRHVVTYVDDMIPDIDSLIFLLLHLMTESWRNWRTMMISLWLLALRICTTPERTSTLRAFVSFAKQKKRVRRTKRAQQGLNYLNVFITLPCFTVAECPMIM